MSDTNGVFEKVDPGVKLYRSRFARRFQKLIDMYPGRLYPILADVMMPGDIVKLGLRWNIKANPSVTPYFTRVKGSVFYFAVPFRMIFGTEYGDSEHFFEELISPPNGDSVNIIPLLTKPEFYEDLAGDGSTITYSDGDGSIVRNNVFVDSDSPIVPPYLVSLSNCFGYETWNTGFPVSSRPSSIKYPATVTFHRAYWRIVTDYFVDEDTMPDALDFRFRALSSLELMSNGYASTYLEPGYPFRTLWSRDYFMSALKDFLKGTPPSFDLGSVTWSGYTQNYADTIRYFTDGDVSTPTGLVGVESGELGGTPGYHRVLGSGLPRNSGSALDNRLYTSINIPPQILPINASIGVDDMRLAFATQRILERANRCGSRYTEYLLSTFKVAPSDGTLQRPWYIGGVRFNIVTPEVLQTSESASTPQGTRSGAGFSVGGSNAGTYHCKEWSVLMAVCNIEPEATYMQGIPRVARYKSRWDFFNPSMQNLSEQVVNKGELFADIVNTLPSYDPSDGFGYQGMWNELRTKQDEVSGNFRWSVLDNWHMALKFNSIPVLSRNFKTISTYQSQIMRPFAVRDMPPFLCDFYHDNIWIRPMVRHPVPGLIDHN